MHPFRRLIVIIDGPNPSFSYYFASRLERQPEVPAHIFNLADTPAHIEPSVFDGALVVFCRYANTRWLHFLHGIRIHLAGVALFLDDDIPALCRDRTVPLPSRLRLWWKGPSQWPRLTPLLGRIIVSTPMLAERFAEAAPLILPPIAGTMDVQPPPDRTGPLRIGYHATTSHLAEHRMLAPILGTVLAAEPDCTMDVIASGRAARLWRGDDRVRILPPRPWPQYRAETAQHGPHILLAPLLPTPANLARAATKRIDAARAGAALLVSEAAIYHPSAEEHALGMLAPLSPAAWEAAILALCREPERRSRLATLNRTHVLAAREAAAKLFAPTGENGWILVTGNQQPAE